MNLGYKYLVTNCITKCVEFLKDVLTIDNIFIGFATIIKICQNSVAELLHGIQPRYSKRLVS